MTNLLRVFHHKNAAMQMHDVNVMPVQLGQDLRLHYFVDRPTRRVTVCNINNAIHHRQHWIHVVSRDENRDSLVTNNSRQ